KDETAYTVQSLSGGERFNFHSCAVAASGAMDAWAKTRETIEDGIDQVIIEGAVDSLSSCDLQSDDKISILSEQATRIELDVEAGQDGWLVIADTWYPGWQASVDGQVVTISRAHYVFRGLPLPAGRHLVVIEYRPWWIWPATGLSLLGILSIAILLFLGRKNNTL
ncbi:YfhO family protein, partial [bacterium]